MGSWLRALAPLIVGAFGFALLPAWNAYARQYPELFQWLPYALLAAAAVPAWLFNRNRVGFAALVVALAWTAQLAGGRIAPAALWLAPLNLAALAWLKERGLLSAHGLLRLGAIGAQVLVLAMIVGFGKGHWLEGLREPWVPVLTRTPVPQGALVLTLLAAAAVGVRLARRREALDSALLFCLLALLGSAAAPAQSAVLIAATGAALLLGLVLDSHAMAYRDELTGLPGRRALNERLDSLGRRYAVAMLDVDHFKGFNDTHGHDVGDQVLRMVAGQIRRVSGGGRAYRYGGEEFTVLFPGRSAAEAEPHLEAVRAAIEGYRMKLRAQDRPAGKRGKARRGRSGKAQTVSVTISIGVAERTEARRLPEQVVKAADEALYRAKRGGRNRVSR